MFTSYTEGFFEALSTVALRYSFMLTNNNYAQNILLQLSNGHNFYLKFPIRQFFPKQKIYIYLGMVLVVLGEVHYSLTARRTVDCGLGYQKVITSS